jgi:hypothetical protein
MQSEDNDRYYIINNFVPITTNGQCEKEAAYGKNNMTMGDVIANALS